MSGKVVDKRFEISTFELIRDMNSIIKLKDILFSNHNFGISLKFSHLIEPDCQINLRKQLKLSIFDHRHQ